MNIWRSAMNRMNRILSMVAAVVLSPLIYLTPGYEESSTRYSVQTSLSDSSAQAGKPQNDEAENK